MSTSAVRRVSALSAALAIAGITALVGAAPASADTPATYYPPGPQVNVGQADLTGWTLCYSGPYGTSGVPLYGAGGILSALCTDDYLMLAGGPLDNPILTVVAAAPRADVIFDTTTDNTTTHSANGSEWYFNDTWSWGFAGAGDVVDKDNCDAADTNPDLRLCLHITGPAAPDSTLDGGYRAGAVTGLNNSSDYTRYIYQADAIVVPPAPAPVLAATGLDPAAPLLVATGLMVAGLSVVLIASMRRRSTR